MLKLKFSKGHRKAERCFGYLFKKKKKKKGALPHPQGNLCAGPWSTRCMPCSGAVGAGCAWHEAALAAPHSRHPGTPPGTVSDRCGEQWQQKRGWIPELEKPQWGSANPGGESVLGTPNRLCLPQENLAGYWAGAAFLQTFITTDIRMINSEKSLRGGAWKAPLENHPVQPHARAGFPRVGCPGWCPDGIWMKSRSG